MKRRLILAGVVALVAVNLIAFMWWSRGRDKASADEPAPVAQAQPGQTPAGDPGARQATGGGRGFDAPRVMIDDDPKGDLRLEGQVVDADEHPVGGATVVLSSHPPRTTTTTDDGSYHFEDLVARPYTLIARAPAGVAGPVTAKLTGKSDPVILRLRPAGKLTVKVTADGKPMTATVELRAMGMDEQRAEAKDGEAVFRPVAAGGYQLAAWSEGMARTFTWVQMGAGDQEVKLSLTPGAAVSGRVVDDKGAAVAGARVHYSGASDWSQQASDRLDATLSAADGTFRFDALPAGSFRFIAAHGDHAPGTSALVTLDGKSSRDGVAIEMQPGATVRGKVVDGAKHPVASARVRVGVASGRMVAMDAPRQAFTDATGAFAIKGVPRKPLQAVALHESGSSTTANVDATAGDAEVTLVLEVTGAIAGIVVDPQGHPLEGVQVTAGPNFQERDVDVSQWRLRGEARELTDASGKFKLTGLADGSYTVSAQPAATAGRNRRFGEGQAAKTGDTNVRIVLPPEGGVKGRVAFADGTAPGLFTVSAGMGNMQSFAGGDGAFAVDALPPQKYELTVRGPSFQTRVVEVDVPSGRTADAGTITVQKGRAIAGVVVADGQPVAGAKVTAGRMMFGNGTQSSAPMGPMGAGAKTDTTDDKGQFRLTGFTDGDITIVAEHDAIGRSKGLRLPTVMPGQTELTLTLEKFGSLSGVLRSGGKPAEGIFVTVQSTTTPGALFGVASGPDGAYRYDRLAPDTYKVSATVGFPMRGMRFYSKQVDVPPGKEVKVDLLVEEGTLQLDVTLVPKVGPLGGGQAFISSVPITAKTYPELELKRAAAGTSVGAWVFFGRGRPVTFINLAAGTYSVCAMVLPREVQGPGPGLSYIERHSDALPAFCKQIVVQPAPATQAGTLDVEVPPFINDEPGGGSGSSGPPPGGGSGSGSGAPP